MNSNHNNNNNKCRLGCLSLALLVALVALLGGAGSDAQLPVEECYWECIVEYCDFPEDYCNYDCHEICYPIWRKANLGPHSAAPVERPMDALPLRNQGLSGMLNKEETGGRIGKVIKMKLESPAYETLRRGKYVLTRGSPPRGFAMFQDCLSANRKPAINTPSADQQPLSVNSTRS